MTYLELRDVPVGTVVLDRTRTVGLVCEIHTGEYATNKVDRFVYWTDGGRSWNLEVLEGEMLDCESDITLAVSA